jgi:hypothetical protein
MFMPLGRVHVVGTTPNTVTTATVAFVDESGTFVDATSISSWSR